MFIGLNPSTADETKDDPTVRRCIRFADDWGYGGLLMSNIFALRSTDPKKMMEHPEPVGEENDVWLRCLARQAGVVIAAWGTHGAHLGRDGQVRNLLPDDVHCLGLTKHGFPKHPLYLSAETQPQSLNNTGEPDDDASEESLVE